MINTKITFEVHVTNQLAKSGLERAYVLLKELNELSDQAFIQDIEQKDEEGNITTII